MKKSNDTQLTDVKSIQKEPDLGQRFRWYKVIRGLSLSFGILEALIALRILLKLIGVNPENPLVALIYGLTAFFLTPFAGIIRSPMFGGLIVEISSMLAITIYALIAVALEKAIQLIFLRGPGVDVPEATTNEHEINP